MEVVCIKKYWRGIDPLLYALIVLEDCREPFRPCPPYPLYPNEIYRAFFYMSYLPPDVLENMLVLFHGS